MGYAPSVVSSKSRRSSTRSASTRSASTASSAVSKVFSHRSDKSCRTTSSSPPPSTASLPSVYFAHAVPNPPHNPQFILPCEFARLGLCNETFGPYETGIWEDHIVVDHFESKPPPHCICWFCDKEFASNDHHGDRGINFALRLEHIREHFLQDGLTAQQMRPDYFLLEHLHLHKLLPKELYQRECKRNEGPRASGIVRHDYIPPERLRAKELESRVVHDNDKEERRRRRGQRQQPTGRRPGPRH
ncbi:hypothetical protein PG991_012692 [Apiospora marii]|uniref:C2H2-type domain-containing protein n=1 Tax=Apiospora marii TaxID=335849 RepID=A0ABR1RAJ8_9PEZI